MNRPKITKQTLKELRGELLAKQSAQKRSEQEYKESLLEEKHEGFKNMDCENNSQTEMDFEEEMGIE